MWALHRVLEGMPDAYAPYEWMVSRYCEEFSCTPTVACREMESDPLRLGETIIMLRAYSSLKDAVDRRIAGSQETIKDSPLLRIVLSNTEKIALERK